MSDTESDKQPKPSQGVDQGKPPLLDDLYRRYWQELCHYLKSRYGDGPPEPEDVAQATFAKFASLQQPTDIENPRAFLYRVANNLVTDEYRRKATREKYLTEETQLEQINKSAEPEPESVLMMSEMNLSLEAALLELDTRERDFLLLHRIQKLSYTEIAQRSGMSRNGVKAVIVKALGKCEKSVSTVRTNPRGSKSLSASSTNSTEERVGNSYLNQGGTQ
jgi:RNA polymerase sigma factor (sigma-70 family)